MPETGVFDVAEIMIHDHFVRRDISDARGPTSADHLRFPESAEGDWRRFQWPGKSNQPAHMNDAGLWMMPYANGGHLQQALKLLDESPGQTAAGIPMYHHVRAGLLESAGRSEEARNAYELALQLDPELAESAINLGLLLGSLGEVPKGMDLLDRVIERFPLASGALRNRAVLRGSVGDNPGARQDLERAFAAEPRAKIALALASLCSEAGDVAAAVRWRGLAKELDPGHGVASQ